MITFSGKRNHLSDLTIDELAQLYASSDMMDLAQRNLALSRNDMLSLFEQLGQYLELSIHKNHLNKIIKAIAAYRSSAEHQTPLEQQNNLETLYKLMTTSRAYDPAQHPAYLTFEYFFGNILRQSQVEALNELTTSSNNEQLGTVLEMIMGSGKTAVLLRY